MSHGRLSQLIWIQLLLFVVALQAMTPDAQDLASSHGLLLFAPAIAGSIPLEEQDEWRDDVCDPAPSSSAITLLLSRRDDQAYSRMIELAMIPVPLELNDLALILTLLCQPSSPSGLYRLRASIPV